MGEFRAVSVGQQLDDPRVRNVGFKSSVTLLGADVAILNLSEILNEYGRDFPAEFQGSPMLNESDSFRSDKDIARRENEIRKLFALGKTVVVFTPPPRSWFVASGEKTYSGTGKNRQTTNIVNERPLNDVFPFALKTAAAVSEDLELSSSGGPFASFWAQVKDRFAATATLREWPGTATVNIAGTDEAVAGLARIDAGTLILLPGTLHYEDADYPEDDETFVDPQDVSFLDPLFDLIKELRRDTGDFELPPWADQYAVPGEDEAKSELDTAEKGVEAALEERDKRKEELARIQRQKLLFTGTGAALETVVEEALTALGFKFEPARPNRADRIATRGRSSAVVEVKGKKKSASERDAAQLEKWVAEFVEDKGEEPEAILVVNAWRSTPLSARTDPSFPDQMVPYSEKRGHCLMTGAQLLAAWREAEAKRSKKSEIARSILKCVGCYTRYSEDGGDVVKQLPAQDRATT